MQIDITVDDDVVISINGVPMITADKDVAGDVTISINGVPVIGGVDDEP